jgi:hypothetical protein
MQMRTNGNTVETLARQVEATNWFDYTRALWVMAFVVKLMRFGSVARHDSPRGEQAAMRLASHLGQLVEDPLVVRAESASRCVDGNFADAQLLNHFVREFLVAFGLIEKMRLALPALQSSDDPLFTEEAWPQWWHWAETDFLV